MSGRIASLLASEPEAAAAQVRHVVDQMCRLADWAALLAQAGWELQGGEWGEVLDLLELYRLTWLDPVDPQAPELPALWRRVAEAAWGSRNRANRLGEVVQPSNQQTPSRSGGHPLGLVVAAEAP